MATDLRIDAYIARAQPFARPILEQLRAAVHDACPDAEEAIKWSMPAFTHGGRILATMAAFKAHAAFGFWNGDVVDGAGGEKRPAESAMGQFGRLRSVADLPPPDELRRLIRKAAAAERAPKPRPARKPALDTPDDLRVALDAVPAAAATFDGFPPGARRDYVEWVTDAKQPATRARRIAQAVEWLAAGKKRNWKYEAC